MHCHSVRECLEEDKKKFIQACDYCSICLEGCQPMPHQSLRISSFELMKNISAFLKNGIYSQEVYDFAYSCSLCGGCEKNCPKSINLLHVITVVKEEMVNQGYEFPAVCKISLPEEKYNIMRVLDSLQVKPEDRRWVTRVPQNPVPKEVVYFLGCFAHQTPHITYTSLDILKKMGIDYVALGGVDYCCGEMDLSVGNRQVSDKLAKNLVTAIEAFQPKTVVFLCGGCLNRFTRHLPLFLDFSFEVKPLIQVYLENIDKIKFTKSLDQKVTYHDSCAIGRRSGLFEGPRELLKKIPGVEVVDMDHSRENSRCCGGMNLITNPEVAESMGKELGKEVKSTGANKVITSCLGCDLILGRIGCDYDFSVEMYISLLGRAMGIEYEDKLARFRSYNNPGRILEETKEYIEASPFSLLEMEDLIPKLFPSE